MIWLIIIIAGVLLIKLGALSVTAKAVGADCVSRLLLRSRHCR